MSAASALARARTPRCGEEVRALGSLPPEIARLLREHIDKPVCGLGRTLGLVGADDEHRPSASFVAQQAAALVVGALLRGGVADVPRFVQYDALFGPMADVVLPRAADRECRCQVDSEIIRQTRTLRLNGPTGRLQ